MKSFFIHNFELLKSYLRIEPKYLLAALIGLLMVAIYIFSKSAEKRSTEYYKETEPEFENGQILEKQSLEFYREKDKIYRAETIKLKKQNQELVEKIENIESKFDEILQKGSALKIHKKTNEQLAEEIIKSMNGGKVPSYPSQGDYKIYSPDVDKNEKTLVKQASSVKKASPKPLRKSPIRGPETVSFPVKKGKPRKDVGPVLPSGSFAKGAILTGIDAPTGRTLPSLIELDFAYIAPNNFKVDLKGCFLIMKSSADLSSQRVEMQPERISCVAKSGRFFERKTNGYVADGFDNRFAMKGKLVENFGNKLLKATLAAALEGAGKAIQMGQTTTSTNPLGGQSSTVTGKTAKFIAGGAASSASSMIAKWYLGQVNKMLPVIRVESGKSVWVVMTEKIELPKNFFQRVSKEKINVPIQRFINNARR